MTKTWIVLLGLLAQVLLQSQTQASKEPLQALRFRLQVNSLEPAQISLPEGRYLIRVINAAIFGDISVQLDDERNARLGAADTKKGRVKSAFEVNLKPGKHVLSVPGRSAWRSEITVTETK